jgi:hypothetical protein
MMGRVPFTSSIWFLLLPRLFWPFGGALTNCGLSLADGNTGLVVHGSAVWLGLY